MKLLELYEKTFGTRPVQQENLAKAGSNRQYVRLTAADGTTTLGVVTPDTDESQCFVYLARHFRSRGLPAPEIFATDENVGCYIQEDFGKEALYDALKKGRTEGYSESDKSLLEKTIRLLAHVQVEGAIGLDWERLTTPRHFSRRAAMFDLNYFKYMFLRTSDVPFDEERLEDDMQQLAADLTAMDEGHDTFLYRDFQARNVMLREGEPCLIDFQGGQRGPVYYDVASFLMQASAHYPEALRKELAASYLDELQGLVDWAPDETTYYERLRTFMFFRTLQVLGAYGLRGRFERKQYFLDSIPPALKNLRALIEQGAAKRYKYLEEIALRLTQEAQP